MVKKGRSEEIFSRIGKETNQNQLDETIQCTLWLHRASNNVEPFYYQLMHIMLKNTELLKHSKITLLFLVLIVFVQPIFSDTEDISSGQVDV